MTPPSSPHARQDKTQAPKHTRDTQIPPLSHGKTTRVLRHGPRHHMRGAPPVWHGIPRSGPHDARPRPRAPRALRHRPPRVLRLGPGRVVQHALPYFRTARLQAARKLPFYINAADALLPWTRGDWNRLVGGQRAVTDVGSFYTQQLVRAYPEAKVILVERPVDAWKASFGEVVMDGFCCGARGYTLGVLGPWAGFPVLYILQDIIMGWLGAGSRGEAWAKMDAAHAEYYAMVRREVPREQVLEFRHRDGWGPLCEFLNVAVPDGPFPRVNDRAEMLGMLDQVSRRIVVKAATRLGWGVLCLACAVLVLAFFWQWAWGDVCVGGWAGCWRGEL